MAFSLTEVVPWGRSYEEYISMFGLLPDDLNKSIIGCADGPASFNASLSAQGSRVVSVDPIYQFNKEEIKQRIDETFDIVMQQTADNRTDFCWDKISTVNELGEIRTQAMNLFLEDYNEGLKTNRYLPQALPKLTFADKSFDIALCSHFLFLYSDTLSTQFHIDSIIELCRIADEVRIFPLLDLSAQKSKHLSIVIETLSQHAYSAKICPVEYEFQKGGNEMLRIHSV